MRHDFKLIKGVTCFGFAGAQPGDGLWEEVVDTSRVLAENGLTVYNGGGPGVMKASTVGAHMGGGKAVGVTFYPQDMKNFEGRDRTNDVDQEEIYDNYLERTLALLKHGDAHICFNGGTGTVSEFGMAWGLARLYFGISKPLIFYGAFWHNIIEAFAQNMKIREGDLRVYRIVTTPEGAIEALWKFEMELEKVKMNGKYPKGDLRSESAFHI